MTALARALGVSRAENKFTVERQRLAGRSHIYVISASQTIQGLRRWVVKQPRIDWRQDDLPAPVSAEQEFDALTRLHHHLGSVTSARTGKRLRVPTPVALLPEISALAMEHVQGHSTREMINYGSLRRPHALLDALAAGGDALRHVHSLDSLPPAITDLRDLARQVLDLADAKLLPTGLSLPRKVREVLDSYPSRVVELPQVRLHGDFGPGNVMIAADGSTVVLDPALDTIGPPEVDLTRYVAVVSGSIRLAPEVVLPTASRLRQRLVRELLAGYGENISRWSVDSFELYLLQQLVTRWLRLRELAAQSQSSALLPLRQRTIDAQVRLQLRECAHRLADG